MERLHGTAVWAWVYVHNRTTVRASQDPAGPWIRSSTVYLILERE